MCIASLTTRVLRRVCVLLRAKIKEQVKGSLESGVCAKNCWNQTDKNCNQKWTCGNGTRNVILKCKLLFRCFSDFLFLLEHLKNRCILLGLITSQEYRQKPEKERLLAGRDMSGIVAWFSYKKLGLNVNGILAQRILTIPIDLKEQ